jgi:mono/diheme cytochrome c family protein
MRNRFTAAGASVVIVILAIVALALHLPFAAASSPTSSSLPSLISKAHAQRLSANDLAISGDLAGLPAGSTRYLSREDLLTLPQVTYTVTDDANFTKPTEISGVSLDDLARSLAGEPPDDLVIAICSDQYHSHYTRAYLAGHHPLLVLKVNGQPPEGWPKDAEGHGQSMGPYLISHGKFTPAFNILAHQDEAQIPWGVVGLEFRNEKMFLGTIGPPRNASDVNVQAGYRIAQQNCLRCHNLGDAGGQKARHPWLVLSRWATASPEHFAAYIRNPQSENPRAEMPGNPKYDDATVQALIAYFRTFQPAEKP